MMFTLPTAAATRELGQHLGLALKSIAAMPQVIALNGDLGAGKTTFVAGVLAGMGIGGPVRSPTYTLIEPYEAGGRFIYHLDLYRLAGPQDLEALGLRDLHDVDSTLLIEWAERGAGALPPIDIALEFSYASGEGDLPGEADSTVETPRELHAVAHSRAGKQLLLLITHAS